MNGVADRHLDGGGVEVIEAGALATVQDLGRPGWAHLGVPRSGAIDMDAHIRANALVGNAPQAATLELTATGGVLRARQEMVVAVTGARCGVYVGSVPAPWSAPIRLAAGQRLEVAQPEQGWRNYVAVRGGIDVDPVLGSRATDLLSGVGPDPLKNGDVLPIGPAEPATPELFRRSTRRGTRGDGDGGRDPLADRDWSERDEDEPLVLDLTLGPRADWFTPGAVDALVTAEFIVSMDSNRVGVRLDGPRLDRSRSEEMLSEGMVLGAVQVPASGQPIVFLADHPTTGGYPVIAVLTERGLARAAQARPGERVRFSIAA